MTKKKVLCFDFDGTLTDSTQLEHASILKTLNDFGNETVNGENLENYYGPTEPGIIRNLIGEDEFPSALSYFFRIYSELQEQCLKPLDGMKELLEELHSNPNIHVILVTGRSRETLDISLNYLDYEKYFEKTYTGSMDGVNKDESMNQAVKDFDLEKEDFLYIGDTTKDIEVMKDNDYDIFSVGYCHNEEYQKKLEEMNPNTFLSVEELKEALKKVI